MTPERPPPQASSPGLRIARPFGIPVYISSYWFVIAGLFVVLYANSAALAGAGSLRYVVAAAFVVLLYVSVLVHELSHSVVARGFGLPVRRILLYPLGGFSEIEQDPPTPGKELLVSAAGPLISLVLAAVGYALLAIAHPVGLPGLLIKQLVWANLLVGIFNLLPGLPLDGGRMLRAVVWKITGKPGSATVAAAWAGRVLAIAVLIVPLAMLYNNKAGGNAQIFDAAWLAVIAAFIWVGAGQALRATRVRERLPGLQARTLARRAIPIPASLPLAEAIRRADAAQARALVIVDHEDKPIAIVNETAVMATPPQRRPWIDAGSLSRSIDPGLVLPADLSGMALIEAVNRHRATEYLLVEPSGQVYGVLAASDLDQAFAGT
ncbi:MAG TPA: site-2 protease family protein [Candidatus Dormibacteraeota bacterium]|jgi:Zn-dependent protease